MKNSLNDLKILTPNGFKEFAGIRRKQADSVRIHFVGDNEPMEVSTNHVFISGGKEIVASSLMKGDLLTHSIKGYICVHHIEQIGTVVVYDPVDVSGDNLYYSNYVISHNCSFIGSTATLIASEYLEVMSIAEPIALKYDTNLRIYKNPEQGKTYILGIDVAEGVGGDSSIVQVLSIDAGKRMEQVAVYSCNTIIPYDFAQVCIGISDFYNGAMMLIENNNIGQVLLTTIWYDYDVDRVINTDTKKGRRELGIRASSRTKSLGTTNLKRCIENGWLLVVDGKTINELSQFEEVRPGIFKASSETGHDDHVMALLWGAFYIESGFFETPAEAQAQVIDENYMLMPGVVDDDNLGDDYIPKYLDQWSYDDSYQYQADTLGSSYDYLGQYNEYAGLNNRDYESNNYNLYQQDYRTPQQQDYDSFFN